MLILLRLSGWLLTAPWKSNHSLLTFQHLKTSVILNEKYRLKEAEYKCAATLWLKINRIISFVNIAKCEKMKVVWVKPSMHTHWSFVNFVWTCSFHQSWMFSFFSGQSLQSAEFWPVLLVLSSSNSQLFCNYLMTEMKLEISATFWKWCHKISKFRPQIPINIATSWRDY